MSPIKNIQESREKSGDMKLTIRILIFVFIAVPGVCHAKTFRDDNFQLKGEYSISSASENMPLYCQIDRWREVPDPDSDSWYQSGDSYGDDSEGSSGFPHTLHFDVGSALELGYGEQFLFKDPIIFTNGIKAVVGFDDYYLLLGNLSMGNEIVTGWTMNIGLEAVLGMGGTDDDYIGGVGVKVFVEYDQKYEEGVTFEFNIGMSLAPTATCFLDAEEFLEFKTTIGMNLFSGETRGTIYVGFRYIDIQFENEEVSEGTPVIGFRYRF